MAPAPTPPAGPAPPRLLIGGALFALVLLAHGLLLAGLPLGVGEPRAGERSRPIAVRRIELPAVAAQVAPEPPAVPATPPVAAAPRRASRTTPIMAAVADRHGPLAADSEAPSRSDESDQPAGAAASASGSVAMVPEASASAIVVAEAALPAEGPPRAPASSGGELPVYPTRIPAPVTLHYELKRGAISGQGTLEWRPERVGGIGDGYELSLEGSVFGISVLSWRSRGGFDSAGLAPERFLDSRRGRDLRAANFQREAHKITFSGNAIEYPLPAGAQDRLSWLLQLAAILEADPARCVAGEKVSMFVAGARGDGDVWTFSVLGVEALDLGGTRLPGTLALRRDPRMPYDTQVEVWLDPARHHLPARMRLTTLPSGDSTEFSLVP